MKDRTVRAYLGFTPPCPLVPSCGSVRLEHVAQHPTKLYGLSFGGGVETLTVTSLTLAGVEQLARGPVPAVTFISETSKERAAREDLISRNVRQVGADAFACELCRQRGESMYAVEHADGCPLREPEPVMMECSTLAVGETIVLDLTNTSETAVRVQACAKALQRVPLSAEQTERSS